jgi:uncharacterized protein YdiU (UPF0061 family)
LLNEHELDFSHTFRTLCQFPGLDSPHYDEFVAMLVPEERIPKHSVEGARPKWREWLKSYASRLPANESTEERTQRMQAANPRFVLRQWVLEEAIKRVEESQDTQFLARLLEMSANPFKSYGEQVLGQPQDLTCPDKATQEAARLCSMGSDMMLGFQCSCSS